MARSRKECAKCVVDGETSLGANERRMKGRIGSVVVVLVVVGH